MTATVVTDTDIQNTIDAGQFLVVTAENLAFILAGEGK